MAQYDPQTCEAKIAGSWHLVSLEEALSTHLTALKRCPTCHGPILINTFGKPARRRFVHRRAHPGCPRIPKMYSGTPSRHPDPVT